MVLPQETLELETTVRKSVQQRFALIDAHYENLRPGSRARHTFETRHGWFAHTPVKISYAILRHLVQHNVIGSSSLMLEAGCGDGRIAATAACLGVPVVAVEGDDGLATETAQSIQVLADQGALDPSLVTVACGNFLEDETYARLGFTFNQFTHVFNYHNGIYPLFEKMDVDSPEDTVLLFTTDHHIGSKWREYDAQREGLIVPRVLMPEKEIGYYSSGYCCNMFTINPSGRNPIDFSRVRHD